MSTGRVRVVYFPKCCTACGSILYVVRKFSGAWWFECRTCETEPL